MDAKKYLIAVLVVFVAHSALAYFVHQVLMEADYGGLTFVREFGNFTDRIPLLYLGNLIFSLVFCFIYTRGYEQGKSWFTQGVRYGLLVGTLLVPVALTGYVALPVSALLVLKLVLYNYLHVVASALVAAAIYKAPPLPLPS